MTEKIENEQVATTIRLGREAYRDFKAVCLCKDVEVSLTMESLMIAFTEEHATEASNRLKKVGKRAGNATA